MSEYISKWHRELGIFSKINSILILEGNVLDRYQYPIEGIIPKGSILRLTDYLFYAFKDLGYQNVVFYDAIHGFFNDCEDGGYEQLEKFGELTKAKVKNNAIEAAFSGENTAVEYIRSAMTQSQTASVVILDFASRYITDPSNMSQDESDAFTILQQISMESSDVKTDKGNLKNLIILLVNKTNDIPAWFYLDNPNVKTITLQKPVREEREQFVKSDNFRSFFARGIFDEDMPYYRNNPGELEKIQDRFVGLTEGFSFTELNGLRKLCKQQQFHIKDMCDVVDLYKYGVKENPWTTLDHGEIREAHKEFRERIKGQDQILDKTLTIVKRAITGMTGIQSSSHARPKGILFFAGPTGTGKTETAKALARKIFGDESRCIRFDMSEYMAPHSDQKLLGAPPGYVGYEAGGQLTNAVKQNPFSILLFDEIEKAHPSIFDKFLQILEDGRMTDGQGNTVYFSETLIIFTSNLGIFVKDKDGNRVPNVTSDEPYEEVQKKVRKAIEDYFKLELGRPEILNRIGENILVFDYIREKPAIEILDLQIKNIQKNLLEEKKIKLEVDDKALRVLRNKIMKNLDNGGRGVGNVVESALINPLANYMFDEEEKITPGCTIKLEEIKEEGALCTISCTVVKNAR